MTRIGSPRPPAQSASRPTAEKRLTLVAGKTDQRVEVARKQPLTVALPPGRWQVLPQWGSDVRLVDSAGAHRKLPAKELSGTIRVALHGDADVLLLRNVKTEQRASVHLVDPAAAEKPRTWGPGGRARLPDVVPNRAGEEWH